jgi:CheY-like chemotaxis protein
MNAHKPAVSPLLLIAEDHRVNRALIQRMLDALGYRTVVVENGRQAVDAVRTTAFDAVLLDLEMPVMGGLEAASAIRGLGSDAATLPLLALTAHSPGEFEHDAKRHGFDGYISKPISPRDLDAVLRELIRDRV